jgi:thymidylate synthase (FAD)
MRAIVEDLDNILDQEFKILDKGFLRVIDYMGDESAIVSAARLSYGKGTKSVSKDAALIDYLLRHKHTSVVEQCVIKFHVKMPIFVARQFLRSRTLSVNEYSARYSEIKEEFYVPEKSRLQKQSTTNKQGSDNELLLNEDCDNFIDLSKKCNENFVKIYNNFNQKSLARELNRINAPVSNYTEFYFTVNLHNLLHFIRLRADSHAQYEIREYALKMLDIVKIWTPNLYQSFMNHIVNGNSVSANNIELLKSIVDKNKLQDLIAECNSANGEKKEFAKILNKLL